VPGVGMDYKPLFIVIVHQELVSEIVLEKKHKLSPALVCFNSSRESAKFLPTTKDDKVINKSCKAIINNAENQTYHNAND
jgi:hypothetical protein